LVFCRCLSFLHMFSFVTVNACVQLVLLIVKCLLDYTYLSRQINRHIASTFKTVVIAVLLIFVYLLWKKLSARVLIVSVIDRLDLARM
jgi:K+ transporter